MIKIIEKDINELVPYENNARINDKAIDIVANSIQEFGFKNPVIIDKDNVLVAGHTRVEACKRLGITKVPCIVADDLTEEQIKAFRIADNSSAQVAEWDMDKLMAELETIDYDMSKYGLAEQMAEIEKIIEENKEVEEDDFDAELPEEPKAQLGDIYQLGNHRLMCGDSTKEEDVAKLMNGNKADMVFTDPPYGMSLDTDYSKMDNGKSNIEFKQRKNIIGGKKYEQGIVDDFNPKMIDVILSLDVKEIFLWGADYFAELLPNKNDGSWIVWDKRDENEQFDKMFGSQFELCWSKNKHKREIARIRWCGVFGTETEFDHKRYHPTQKPIKLSSWFLNRYSNENDNILDLFGGSGSTLIACEQLNRNCYMMELDPKYVDVIIARWEQFTGKKAEKIC